MKKVTETKNYIIGEKYKTDNGIVLECKENSGSKDECKSCHYNNLNCWKIDCNWARRDDGKAVYFVDYENK